MGKITVKHYLNKGLNPRIVNNKKQYPVYIQVFVLGKSLRFKSANHFFEYMSEADFENGLISNVLSIEREDIEKIVNSLISIGKPDLITSKNLNFYSQNAVDVIDNNFNKLLDIESNENSKFIPSMLLSATYSEIRELIYFYNDESPIADIGYNVKDCLDALNQLWDYTTKEIVLVFDFFYGDKFERFMRDLRIWADGDAEKANRLIQSIQKLLSL